MSKFFHTVLIAFSVFSALFMIGCTGRPIASVPTETEAIEIEDILRENEIQSQHTTVGEDKNKVFQITVSQSIIGEDNYSNAIQILRDHCLPHSDPPPIEESGLTASVEAEKAKTQRQLKMNIIRQLRQLPGVTCVDVNLVMPQDRLARLETYPSSAAVTIGFKNATAGFTEDEVKNLVSRSIPDLKAEMVAVKLSYQPPRQITRNPNRAWIRLAIIGGVALVLMIGVVFVVFWLQIKRRKNSSENDDEREIVLVEDAGKSD
jgi:type III secretory pathway lipoprotein EscJ